MHNLQNYYFLQKQEYAKFMQVWYITSHKIVIILQSKTYTKYK